MPTYTEKTSYNYVLAVGGTSANLRKTGQVTSFHAGDDGAIQAGVDWPANRFQVNTDKTMVTDKFTGLIWVRDGNLMVTRDPSFDQDDLDRGANDGRVYWASALSYIAKLNTENYLGFHDWRLPNRKELLSLVDYEQILLANWLNANGFRNFGAGSWVRYWSSSTRYHDRLCFRIN